jgi:hypothetical protein
MKEFISVILFFVIFTGLNKLTSLIFPSPPHFIIVIVIWLMYGLISLVLCKLIYDKLEDWESSYLPPKRRAAFFLSILLLTLSVMGYNYWDTHREKSIDSILSSSNPPTEIHFTNLAGDEWRTEDQEIIQEILEDLGPIRIKKTEGAIVVNSNWQIELIWENKSKIKNAKIIDNHLWINYIDHYTILNGPIEEEWLKDYRDNFSDSITSGE